MDKQKISIVRTAVFVEHEIGYLENKKETVLDGLVSELDYFAAEKQNAKDN